MQVDSNSAVRSSLAWKSLWKLSYHPRLASEGLLIVDIVYLSYIYFCDHDRQMSQWRLPHKTRWRLQQNVERWASSRLAVWLVGEFTLSNVDMNVNYLRASYFLIKFQSWVSLRNTWRMLTYADVCIYIVERVGCAPLERALPCSSPCFPRFSILSIARGRRLWVTRVFVVFFLVVILYFWY